MQKPITLEQAKQLSPGQYLYHIGQKARAKVNGCPKTWKTRPNAVRVPMKYGLYDCFQMGCGDTDRHIDQPLENWSLTECID